MFDFISFIEGHAFNILYFKLTKPMSHEREKIPVIKKTTVTDETNKYAVASQFEPATNLSRARLTHQPPVQVHYPASKPAQYVYRQRMLEMSRVEQLEPVDVRLDEEAGGIASVDYAVVNKVTPVIAAVGVAADAEMIVVQQQPHQATESGGEERSSSSVSMHDGDDDTLNNLNLDTFEPVTSGPRELVRIEKRALREESAAEATYAHVRSVVQHDDLHPQRIPVKVSLLTHSSLQFNIFNLY